MRIYLTTFAEPMVSILIESEPVQTVIHMLILYGNIDKRIGDFVECQYRYLKIWFYEQMGNEGDLAGIPTLFFTVRNINYQ